MMIMMIMLFTSETYKVKSYIQNITLKFACIYAFFLYITITLLGGINVILNDDVRCPYTQSQFLDNCDQTVSHFQ